MNSQKFEGNNLESKPLRVVYAVYGEDRNFSEMERSAESLLHHHPSAIIECYTDQAGRKKLKDFPCKKFEISVNPRETSWHDPLFKVSVIRKAAISPFVFLDNDTYVAAALTPAWELLSKFDLLACLAPITNQRKALSHSLLERSEKIPEAFSEMNSGVLFLAHNDRIKELLSLWHDLLYLNPEELGDQWRFRIALYESSVSFCTLPNNFNYRIQSLAPLYGTLRIIHGRHKNLVDIARGLNSQTGYRHIVKTNDGLALKEPERSSVNKKIANRFKKLIRRPTKCL